MKDKKYSWISFTSFGLGVFVILHPILANIYPKFFMVTQYIGIGLTQYIGIILTIILSVIALLKKNEKKPLAIIGLIMGIIMMIFAGILLYISFNKYSPY
ncbi:MULTISPECIES: hypothetical protein [Bacillaceae]|uniref:hypothetical protein n=1 Tax=Bacillaceae TaxID=186817 RepID=UPI000776CFF2|nr:MULTISPECIES: hypothetical protein [Bacillaceae]AMM93044.1 hypothetical protein UP17_11395 [Peribacillus simplex]USL11074.1 hypothetical protein LIT24_29650 [Bacillus bombysepticus]